MSYVIAAPEFVTAAASDLANIGSTVSAANAAAATQTTGVLAAGADEVSAAIAALFGSHAQSYQALSAQAAAFHDQFVQLMNGGAASYASTEAANAEQAMLNAVNAPTQALLGRPLISNGTPGGTVNGMGQPGGPGGILFGDGGTGGNTTNAGMPGGNGGPAGLFGTGGTGGQGGPGGGGMGGNGGSGGLLFGAGGTGGLLGVPGNNGQT